MEATIIQRSFLEKPKTSASHLHPLLRRIFAARLMELPEALERELKHLYSYDSLSQIDKAVDRLLLALTHKENILIIGDYDADGATSTALAVYVLRRWGSTVDFLVPNRFEYGYGLTPEIVNMAVQQQPHLIITVDSGISSLEGVARATELGIDVLITDHHLAGEKLPTACAIVNPNQPDDAFPSKTLAGVGVIFYVMLALRTRLKENGWFEQTGHENFNMAEVLDLVALGTVADVVPLDKNNRILVYQGLRRIQAGYARCGIKALLKIAGRDPSRLAATDLGFVVGPRLNAAGRLDDMSIGIRCLLSEDEKEALEWAQELDALNRERRQIEMEMQKQALEEVEKIKNNLKPQKVGFCLYRKSWHQGVIGLVASRIKDRVHRPVIAFAEADEKTLKGSARSISQVHIRDVLADIATQHPHLLSKFGGHAMAAGLTLEKRYLAQFTELFEEAIARQLGNNYLGHVLETDGGLTTEELALEMAELIQNAGPWGQGCPEPAFNNDFDIVEQRLVGKNHLKLLVKTSDSPTYYQAIFFNVNVDQWPNERIRRVHMVYRLGINEYLGSRSLQLMVDYLKPLE